MHEIGSDIDTGEYRKPLGPPNQSELHHLVMVVRYSSRTAGTYRLVNKLASSRCTARFP